MPLIVGETGADPILGDQAVLTEANLSILEGRSDWFPLFADAQQDDKPTVTNEVTSLWPERSPATETTLAFFRADAALPMHAAGLSRGLHNLPFRPSLTRHFPESGLCSNS